MVNLAMITFNGGLHLQAQLDSLMRQTVVPRALYVSDDGSCDDTLLILRRFAAVAPFEVRVMKGPQAGPAANMLSLLTQLPSGPVAMVDQDDIWKPNRLEMGLPFVTSETAERSAVLHVCSRNRPGRTFPKSGASFANALVENHAPGNATMMNAAALQLMQEASCYLRAAPPFHDWLLMQLVTGVGGQVKFEPMVGLNYRAHRGNVLGPARSVTGMARRIHALWSGQARHWVWAQAQALKTCGVALLPQNANLLDRLLTEIAAGRCPIRWPIARCSRVQTAVLTASWRLPHMGMHNQHQA